MTAPPGPRTVSVAPERLPGWLDGFADRHGRPSVEVAPERLVLLAPDGARAVVRLAWGPLTGADPLAALVEDSARQRRVGALIARRKAHAVGLFSGERLLGGRHGSHYVQGRTKAGGWSQQRYARRRANQAEKAFESAARDVAELLLPELDTLDALAIGGDSAAIASVLAAPGLEPLRDPSLRRLGVFSVPDPNASVLAAFPATFRRVQIDLNELA